MYEALAQSSGHAGWAARLLSCPRVRVNQAVHRLVLSNAAAEAVEFENRKRAALIELSRLEIVR